MIKRFFLTIVLVLVFTSMVHAATYIVCRSEAYTRSGIDDVGDIYEIFEGPHPPGGTGYELAEIIKIEVLSKDDVEAKLRTLRPEMTFDQETQKEYWRDPESGNFYEIKISPKYKLNAANLTLADKVILADEQSTSVQQLSILDKIEANVAKYLENYETLMPTGP